MAHALLRAAQALLATLVLSQKSVAIRHTSPLHHVSNPDSPLDLAVSLEETAPAVRVETAVFLPIGFFGLVLACLGLAGVTAQAVERRPKEFGIQLALDARGAQLMRLVEGVGNSPMLVIGIPALLVSLAAIACYIPARRSSNIDPMIALREE